MFWCFAIVNNRLAEIYFDNIEEGNKILGCHIEGHCYINKGDFQGKQDKEWIKKDTANFRFSYYGGKYKRINK